MRILQKINLETVVPPSRYDGRIPRVHQARGKGSRGEAIHVVTVWWQTPPFSVVGVGMPPKIKLAEVVAGGGLLLLGLVFGVVP
jgi:hypothetical protein